LLPLSGALYVKATCLLWPAGIEDTLALEVGCGAPLGLEETLGAVTGHALLLLGGGLLPPPGGGLLPLLLYGQYRHENVIVATCPGFTEPLVGDILHVVPLGMLTDVSFQYIVPFVGIA
jgi:hypothetical protein